MTNELAPIPAGFIPTQPTINTDADLDKQAGSSYLPYIRLMVTSAKEVKSQKAKPGVFILCKGKDDIIADLGTEVELMIFSRRGRACRMGGADEKMLNVFDVNSKDYKDIIEEAQNKKRGSWWGTEYLVWLRQRRQIATFHASSITARARCGEPNTILRVWIEKLTQSAAEVAAGRPALHVPNPQATLRSVLTPFKGDNDQFVPNFSPATTPFSEVPDWSEVDRECKRFASPVKAETKAEETQGNVAERG